LDTVMTLSKLVAQKSSNILIIKTLDMATKEKEAELAAAKLKLNSEPTVTRIFLINYATLGDMSKIIKDYTTEKGAIQTDERTNSLIVKDTIEAIERIKKIIETLDTQTPQIMIESKIVEANETFSKNLGLRNGLQFGYDPISPISSSVGPGWVFSTTGNYVPGTIAVGDGGQAGGTSATPLPLSGAAMGFSIGIFRRILNLEFALEMAETENKTKIISSPKIVTQNKKPATLTSSEQTSYVVQQPGTGLSPATQSFNTISANTNLTVTPQVTNDGSISMDISVQKSDFGRTPTGGGPPDINTRNIKTNVLVGNGSTIVIGGIYRTSSSDVVSGIPLLRNLPLVGWLFRTPERKTNSRNELIVFITPRILNVEEAGFSEKQASNPEPAKKEI
jgi:type IV pilus assembly protein PilQ